MDKQELGRTTPHGRFGGRVSRDLGELRPGVSRVGLMWKVYNWLKYQRREMPGEIALALLGRIYGVITLRSAMSGVVYKVDWSKLDIFQAQKLRDLIRANVPLVELPRYFGGEAVAYGVMCRRNVTDTGVGYIVDAFQNLVEPENMKYHALGTGAVAAAQGDTALGAEITASHYTGGARPTGTTVEGASANIYRSVGTHTQLTAGDTVTEHGLLSAVTVGVLLDRHVFTGVALGVGDSFQTTYEITFTANG